MQRKLSRLLVLLWALFFLVFVFGIKTDYLAKGLVLVTALCIAYAFARRLSLAQSVLNLSDSLVRRPLVVAFITATFAATIGSLFADYDALNGTLWDLSQYIQATFAMALQGQPIVTFPGSAYSYFETHRSLSQYLLGLLAKLVGAPNVVLFWQGFFLTAPGLVAVLWYRAIVKQAALKARPLGDLLVFLTWAVTPTVLRIEVWPYAFHIMGLTFIALAYLFYFERRWILWALSLILLAYEKEDFGVVSSSFGILVLFESLFGVAQKRIALKEGLLPLAVSLLVCFTGVYSFIDFHHHHASVVSFGARFGNFGQSPAEAVKTAIVNPGLVFNEFSRAESLKYFWYFLAVSLIWIRPRWSVVKFVIPVGIVLIANALSMYPAMQSLKDPYALPIMVGISATMVLGVFGSVLDREGKEGETKAYAFLMIAALLPLAWAHQSFFRTFKQRFALRTDRTESRSVLIPLREQHDVVVCCEERLCSYLADRPHLLQSDRCNDTSKLWKEWAGKDIVYVIYNDPNRTDAQVSAKWPGVRWKTKTPLLQLSEPAKIPNS